MKVDVDFDARTLRRLVSGGPTVSVYFNRAAPAEVETASPRWHELLDRLTRQGIDSAVQEALTKRVRSSSPGTGVLAAFISDRDEVPMVFEMPGARQPDLVMHAALPYLRPLLTWLQSRPPYVLAVARQTGADIEIHPGGTQEAILRTVTDGADDIGESARARRSHERARHRQQDSWERNAALVAKALTDQLIGGQIRLLLLAGDIRALHYVDKHLSGGVRSQVCVRYVAGRGGAQIDQQLHAWRCEQDQRLLRRITEGRDAGWAAEGATATLGALADGRGRVLVVVDDPQDRRTAWFGPAPTHASLDRAELIRAGVVSVQRAALIDVALRTAILTGAETRILQPGTLNAPAQGIGALCRFGG